MNILLRKVTIADPNSIHYNTVTDIFISNGIIEVIGSNLQQSADTIIEEETILVSPGWVDVFSNFSDPGFEHKETLETGTAAAAAGGFTQVFVVPNTQPAIAAKTGVEYIVQKSKSLPVHIQPLGAITKGCEGKELAEMYDMQSSGAIAFSDGVQPVQSAGLLLKALQYVKAFNGVLVQLPVDNSLAAHGLMHEGIISTRLGLPGIPAIAEELMIKRDIELVKYTSSRLHFTGVSTANSIALIQEAKEAGLPLTCSATPYHLFFCDEDLQMYDTNLKVSPPLRTTADKTALQEAVMNGVIDCIASHHLPQHWDDKTCEFEYARNGMIGLQTSFAAVNTVLSGIGIERLVKLFSVNARTIFGLPQATIEQGSNADLTLFNRFKQTVFTQSSNKSKSSNSPFFEKALSGAVVGIINKGSLHLNK